MDPSSNEAGPTKLENEVNDLTYFFTRGIAFSVRERVLRAILSDPGEKDLAKRKRQEDTEPGSHIGHNNWTNLGQPCLFLLAYLAATGQESLPKDFKMDDLVENIATKLGVLPVNVLHGAHMWDAWNKSYPECRTAFIKNIRDFLIDQDFAGTSNDARYQTPARQNDEEMEPALRS